MQHRAISEVLQHGQGISSGAYPGLGLDMTSPRFNMARRGDAIRMSSANEGAETLAGRNVKIPVSRRASTSDCLVLDLMYGSGKNLPEDYAR